MLSYKEINFVNDFQNMKNKNISILEINANYKYCRSFMLFFLDRQRNFTMIYDKEHMIWNVIVYWAIIFWCLIGNKKRRKEKKNIIYITIQSLLVWWNWEWMIFKYFLWGLPPFSWLPVFYSISALYALYICILWCVFISFILVSFIYTIHFLLYL